MSPSPLPSPPRPTVPERSQSDPRRLEQRYHQAISQYLRTHWWFAHLPFQTLKRTILQRARAFLKQTRDIGRELQPNLERGANSRSYTSARPRISYRQQRHMNEFAAAATAYCQYLEAVLVSPNHSLFTVIHTLYKLLAGLQQAAFRLPDLSTKNYKILPEGFGKACYYPAMELHRLLGGWDQYFDHQSGQKGGKGGDRFITCDLGDIYDDLHQGVRIWALGSPWDQLDAAVFWRYAYEMHWSAHLHAVLLQIAKQIAQIQN